MNATASHGRLSAQTSSSISSLHVQKGEKERRAMNSKLLLPASAAVVLFSALIVIIATLRPGGLDLLRRETDVIAGRAVPIERAVGPESFAFDPRGDGPYTGLSDGRVVKEECEGPHDHEAMEHICGRPLGLGFNHNTGDLYVADAYMGLLVVGPDGGSATKVDVAAGVDPGPLRFANGLDIDQRSGTIYFSDSSTKYQRKDYISLILAGDKTGRLMKYDPHTKRVEVLLHSLAFANGVAMTSDGSSVLISETSSCRILQYCLKTGTTRVFTRLPGFPDNIKRSPRGGYWVGIFSRKGRLLDWLLANPMVGTALTKYVPNHTKVALWYTRWRGRGLAVRLGEEGEVLEVLEGESIGSEWKSVSEVVEMEMETERGGKNKFWVGSVNMPFAGTFLR
ncbi:hypothetical protein CRG98_028770 [Punica granatum]|uniref:Strictosidine synthase conserved region domain-containing protein n=1 Tax=Punica granatum TaxID=22663 RepID=A0A2I0J479_PUNGR|nr:hypothetical protein CRG98_028770 [Punica granatum]